MIILITILSWTMFITLSNSFFHSNLNSFSGRFVLFNKKLNKENTFYQEVVEKMLYDNPRASANYVESSSNSKEMLSKEIEFDYLGMVNFCLRESDTALSVQSRSKVLNAVTNNIFRVLIIGNDQLVNETIQSFDYFREVVDNTMCDLSKEIKSESKDELERACNQDQLTSRVFMDWLYDLISKGITHESMLGCTYDRGYKRLLTILKDAGCRFNTAGKRPEPTDTNICLSLIDLSNQNDISNSKTKVLNEISNSVSRALLYGGSTEQQKLGSIIEAMIPGFIADWKPSGDLLSQEVLYIQSLVLFLREGLEVAENAISIVPKSTDNDIEEYKWVVDDTLKDTGYPKLRLFDVYLNAFQRVVGLCLNEMAARPATNSPQNQEFLSDFVAWEQSLRRNLTEAVWEQNPVDLAGVWELLDVAGQGRLDSMMNMKSMEMFGLRKGVYVSLLKDGSLNIDSDTALGQRWRVKPGPAHLDTCEFTIASIVNPDLLLTYTGYIDRGQRIESRFSKMPIRMTGRVSSSVKGSVVAIGRFIMALRTTRN